MPQYSTSDFNFFIDSEFEKLFSILFLLFIRKIRFQNKILIGIKWKLTTVYEVEMVLTTCTII